MFGVWLSSDYTHADIAYLVLCPGESCFGVLSVVKLVESDHVLSLMLIRSSARKAIRSDEELK